MAMLRDKTFEQISQMPRQELIALFDHENENVQHGLNFIKEEIWRRDADEFNNRFNNRMESIARKMWWATAVIGALTLVNLAFVVFSALK